MSKGIKASYLREIGYLPPPGVDSKEIFLKIAWTQITAKINGKQQKIPVIEAVLQKLRAMSFNDEKPMASRYFCELLTKYRPQKAEGACLIVPHEVSNEEFKEYLKTLPPKERPGS